MPTAHVSVPATSANLGPGFDCIGAAWTLANRFEFTRLPDHASLRIEATGIDADKISLGTGNYVYKAFCQLFEHVNQPIPPLHLKIEVAVPLSRGLGSSATAIVGGLVGANELAGQPLTPTALAALATELEGHPDNVVPALLGGCRLTASGLESAEQPWEICDIPWHPEIVPVVGIPAFELSTQKARAVLPERYSGADAIFNAAHLGLLIRALQTGDRRWLRTALQDRIHQPYRKSLIPGFEQVQDQALAAGAAGVVISGAGPTLLAFGSPHQAKAIAQAMEAAWSGQGISAQAQPVQINPAGTEVATR